MKKKSLGYVIMLEQVNTLACGIFENGILCRDDKQAMVIINRKKANRIIQASIKASRKKNQLFGKSFRNYSIYRLVENED